MYLLNDYMYACYNTMLYLLKSIEKGSGLVDYEQFLFLNLHVVCHASKKKSVRKRNQHPPCKNWGRDARRESPQLLFFLCVGLKAGKEGLLVV